jgi:ATP phosphoribosyltransferase regulatory subunit
MLTTLEKAGLTEITLDLGHVGIYQALIEQTTLSQDLRTELFSLLRLRALPELASWLNASNLPEHQKQWFVSLPNMAGNVSDLDSWRAQFTQVPEALNEAFETLVVVANALNERFPDVNVHVDLAELRDYNYHTGLVFSAFVPGFGQPIARGGRYDATGSVFGRSRPATGFSSDLKILAKLTGSQWSEKRAILAPADNDADLLAIIASLRQQGERVIQLFPEQTQVEELECDRALTKQNGQWTVQLISQHGHN